MYLALSQLQVGSEVTATPGFCCWKRAASLAKTSGGGLWPRCEKRTVPLRAAWGGGSPPVLPPPAPQAAARAPRGVSDPPTRNRRRVAPVPAGAGDVVMALPPRSAVARDHARDADRYRQGTASGGPAPPRRPPAGVYAGAGSAQDRPRIGPGSTRIDHGRMVRAMTEGGRRLGVAIVGLDHWYLGLAAARLVSGRPDARLVVVAHHDAARAERVAGEYRAGRWTTDYEDAVRADDVDVVATACRVSENPAICVAAAEAGKHIVSTKPLALDVAGAEAIAGAVRRAGVRFLSGEMS